MKKLFLLFGDGGHGKTTLAKKLSSKHNFTRISLDGVYLEFIEKSCPMLHFEALKHYIAPHYDAILVHRDWSVEKFGRDFVADWHSYVIATIKRVVDKDPAVVVEGYLLKDILPQLQAEFEQTAMILQIEMREHRCYQGEQEIPIEKLESLAMNGDKNLSYFT